MNKTLQNQLVGGFCYQRQKSVTFTFINVINLTS